MMRVGQGFDVHRLVENRALIIGGVRIAHDKGLAGHSDADVLTHAIIDAFLGAAGLGDIGTLFPDTDPKYKDYDSINLLGQIKKILSFSGWKIINVDSTIIAEEPKMQPHIREMRQTLCDTLNVDFAQISVKATTAEGLGFAGKKEGIAAQAVVLIDRK